MKLICGVIFVICMFIFGWQLAPYNTLQEQKKMHEYNKENLKKEVHALQKEISYIKNDDLIENEKLKEESVNSGKMTDEENLIRPNIEEKMKRLAENYKNIKNYDLSIATKNAFEAEPLESEWAQPRVEALQNLMSSDRSFQGINLKGIECKSKHCRIEIFSNQPSDTDGMTSILNRVIEEKAKSLFIPYTELQYSPEEKTTTIYLTDDPSASLY